MCCFQKTKKLKTIFGNNSPKIENRNNFQFHVMIIEVFGVGRPMPLMSWLWAQPRAFLPNGKPIFPGNITIVLKSIIINLKCHSHIRSNQRFGRWTIISYQLGCYCYFFSIPLIYCKTLAIPTWQLLQTHPYIFRRYWHPFFTLELIPIYKINS